MSNLTINPNIGKGKDSAYFVGAASVPPAQLYAKGLYQDKERLLAGGAAPAASAAQAAEAHELGVLPRKTAPNLAEVARQAQGMLSIKALGFDMSKVIAMLFKSLLTLMKTQSQSRTDDLKMAGDAAKQEANQIRTGAGLALSGAITGAGMQIVGSGVTLGGLGATRGAGGESGNPFQMQRAMMPYQATSEMTGAMAQADRGGFEMGEKTQDAASAVTRAQEQNTRAVREQDSQLYDEVQKFIQQLEQIVQEVNNQEHSTSSQILSA